MTNKTSLSDEAEHDQSIFVVGDVWVRNGQRRCIKQIISDSGLQTDWVYKTQCFGIRYSSKPTSCFRPDVTHSYEWTSWISKGAKLESRCCEPVH